MGMTVTQYKTAYRMDWELPTFASRLMNAVHDYRAQHPIPSYYQQYPQVADLEAHFQRQTMILVEHQTHIRGMWDQEFDRANPEQDQEAQV
ncbi:hypothetical protein A2U01_0071860, partial [Trifolium medium]|nr:hypothetical protein [Trifolium medium]